MPTSKPISGNTMKVYLHLVTHGPSELREVQRGLELSTPSLASYHLNRLIEFGYAKQDKDGKYVAVKEESNEVLSGFQRIGTVLVPQLFFFTVFFTILIFFYSYQALVAPGSAIYLVITSLAVVMLLWYETMRMWRGLSDEPKEQWYNPIIILSRVLKEISKLFE